MDMSMMLLIHALQQSFARLEAAGMLELPFLCFKVKQTGRGQPESH